MHQTETTTLEKALIYGAIAYIIIPSDLIPRRTLSVLGILDDAAVVAYMYKLQKSQTKLKTPSTNGSALKQWSLMNNS